MVEPTELQSSQRSFVSQCLADIAILTSAVMTLFVGVIHVWLFSIMTVFSFTISAAPAPFDSDGKTFQSVHFVLPMQNVCTGFPRRRAHLAQNKT